MVPSRWKNLFVIPLVILYSLNLFNAGYALALAESEYNDVASSRELVGLAEKWNLTDNGVEYSALSFELSYITSDFILENMVAAVAYSIECKEGGDVIPDNDLNITVIPDDTDAGSGDLERDFTVRVGVNAENAESSSVYTVTENQAIVEFCLRFSLYTPGAAIEVNFLETLVTFTANMTAGFEIEEVNVKPKEVLITTAFEDFDVDAYQCDRDNEPLSATELAKAMNQGELIRVCVTPTEDAQEEGVYMRAIESFTYYRDYGGATGLVTQVAIENSEAASNYLTVLNCVPGSRVCSFETILFASMFMSPGFVDGSGTAILQFGSDSATSRRLETESPHRSLEEETNTRSTTFDLDFELLPGEEYMGVLRTVASSSKLNVILSFATIGTMTILNLM